MRQIYAFIVARAILLHSEYAILHFIHTLERNKLHILYVAECITQHIRLLAFCFCTYLITIL